MSHAELSSYVISKLCSIYEVLEMLMISLSAFNI